MENKEDVTKITTKTYYVCGDCQEKLAILSLGGSSSDMFSFFSTSKTAMYCEKKDCEKFGLLTVVGIKREE